MFSHVFTLQLKLYLYLYLSIRLVPLPFPVQGRLHSTFLARFYDRHLWSSNVMCKHLHCTLFNPFLNGEKNGLKNVMCKRALQVQFKFCLNEPFGYSLGSGGVSCGLRRSMNGREGSAPSPPPPPLPTGLVGYVGLDAGSRGWLGRVILGTLPTYLLANLGSRSSAIQSFN